MPIWAHIFPLHGWQAAAVVVATQFLASYAVNLISYNSLSRIYRYFRPREFERNGLFYQEHFRIKGWKDHVPAVGSFDKKHLTKAKLTDEYISQYLLEGLRAELCHFGAIILSFAVLFATIPSQWLIIIGYSALLNSPCIMIQRYNRPRFEKMLRSRDENGQIVFVTFWIEEDGTILSGREERRKRKNKRF